MSPFVLRAEGRGSDVLCPEALQRHDERGQTAGL